MKNKFIKLFIILGLGIIISIIFLLFIKTSKPLPINFSQVNKVEIIDNRNSKPKKLLTIEQKNDISDIDNVIDKARGGYKDNPSCPFSLSMVFYEADNKRTTIVLGTDDCGLIKYQDRYYELSNSEAKALQGLIEKLTGIDFDKLRL